jgi:hypothetical protein
VYFEANISAVPSLVKLLTCHALVALELVLEHLVPALAVILQAQELQATGLEAGRPWALVMVVELPRGELRPERPLGHPMQAQAATAVGLPPGRLKLVLRQPMVVLAT